MAGRSMIVGRGRSHIVGARGPYVGADQDVAELMHYASGADVHAVAPPEAYMRSAGGPQVMEEHPTHPREFPIGFTSATPVGAGLTGSIEVKPQVLFRGERLAVPNSVAQVHEPPPASSGHSLAMAASTWPGSMFSSPTVR